MSVQTIKQNELVRVRLDIARVISRAGYPRNHFDFLSSADNLTADCSNTVDTKEKAYFRQPSQKLINLFRVPRTKNHNFLDDWPGDDIRHRLESRNKSPFSQSNVHAHARSSNSSSLLFFTLVQATGGYHARYWIFLIALTRT